MTSETPPGEAAFRNGAKRLGPILSRNGALSTLEDGPRASQRASWRGWVLGLLAVVFLSSATPYIDFVLKGTHLSFNAFPMFSVVLIVFLALLLNLVLRLTGKLLGMTRQDLTLIFVMTMVTYTLPGMGFWWAWSTLVTGASHFASAENGFARLIFPHLPDGLFIFDPPHSDELSPRPAEWFYSGLPPGRAIPWGAWVGPYLRWMVVVISMYAIWFALATLLSRRWSQSERLPFPVAQVPLDLINGAGPQEPGKKSFFQSPAAWWGIGLTLGLHLWNGVNVKYGWGMRIQTWYLGLDKKYLTEAPWSGIGTFEMNLFPSIIGLTFLLSLEVAFSLWFVYFIKKAIYMVFVPFHGEPAVQQATQDLGTGALLGLAALSFWMARSELGRSLREALGKAPRETEIEEGDASPRLLWMILTCGFIGAVSWLVWAGISLQWALMIVLLFIMVMTGLSRLIAEAGVFATQVWTFPVHIVEAVATPVTLGAKNTTMLYIWDRVFTAEWFRIVPMPNLLNALHLSRQTGLRQKTMLTGAALATALAFAVSFAGVLGTAYSEKGTADWGWFFSGFSRSEISRTAKKNSKIEWYEKKQKEIAEGRAKQPTRPPEVTERDWGKMGWLSGGALTLGGVAALRRVFFWVPHPAGFVLWMSSKPHDRLWFCFFLGWLFKWAISKYGGMPAYRIGRRFFIGMVVGEAMAAIFWVTVGLITGQPGGYSIWIG